MKKLVFILAMVAGLSACTCNTGKNVEQDIDTTAVEMTCDTTLENSTDSAIMVDELEPIEAEAIM